MLPLKFARRKERGSILRAFWCLAKAVENNQPLLTSRHELEAYKLKLHFNYAIHTLV